jgi:hypothetical protein
MHVYHARSGKKIPLSHILALALSLQLAPSVEREGVCTSPRPLQGGGAAPQDHEHQRN